MTVPITRRGKGGITCSGPKSADTLIKTGAGVIHWISVSDTADLAVELNDSLDNSGSDVWAMNIPEDGYIHINFDPPIEVDTGIYLDVSTITCKVTVGYE